MQNYLLNQAVSLRDYAFLPTHLVPAPVSSSPELLKPFVLHRLQTAERGHPVIAVQNAQTSGSNSYRQQGFFKCCIVQDVVERAVEAPLGACIGLAARYLAQRFGHDGLRGRRELREGAVCLFELPGNFAPPRKRPMSEYVGP